MKNIRNMKKWLPLVVLAVLIGGLYVSGLYRSFNLETLQTHKEQFQTYVTVQPFLAALIFVASYIAAVALSLPVATLMTLLGGFLFGKWLGTLFVVLGATGGATLLFLIARSSVGNVLRDKAGPLYHKIAKNMAENAVGYMLFMRLAPLFPFVLVNIVPALFNVPLRIFVLTTFFGILPGSFVLVNLGEALADIESLSDLISGQTLLAIALLGISALIPTVYKQIKNRKNAAKILLLAFLTGIATSTPVKASEYKDFLTLYDGLLKEYVKEEPYEDISYEGVDYDGWAHDVRYEQAGKVLLDNPPQDGMAYWINTYNFLTIDLIIREGERKSIKNLGGFLTSAWEKYDWKIGEQSYTLDQIEHKILRPMGDPRVHFAINCASVSCPDLRGEAYRDDVLNTQLNDQVTAALNNPGKGFRYDPETNTAHVTKIMDWFAADFGDLHTWLRHYKPDQINPETRFEFLDYDWSLNILKNGERQKEEKGHDAGS